MTTHFGLLGPVEARRDGAELALGGRNQRAVLALLLLHANQVVSIERLAEDLYAGAAPATAVTQVHRQVSELRRALDAPGARASLIETRPPGYVVHLAPEQLDLRRFEDLVDGAVAALRAGDAQAALDGFRTGLALWRGPALADLAYESFAQGAIARLEELRVAALEFRLQAELALGRHAIAVPELRDLVLAHPLRERFRELLMLALYRCGRHVEALDVYRATHRELAERFGVDPGPALRGLEQAILRHDPGLAAPDDRPVRNTEAGSVILVGRHPAGLGSLAATAASLAARPRRELIVALLARDEAGLADATAALAALGPRLPGSARTAAFIAARPEEDVLHLARANDADLVLVEASTDAVAPRLAPELAALLEASAADVALAFAPVAPAPAGRGVLVPFAGGHHDWAAVELAAWLANVTGERLRLAGARADPRTGRRDASRLLADASLAVQRLVGVAAEPLLLDAAPGTLAAARAEASAAVIGLSPRWRQEGAGATRAALLRAPECPVLLVHRGLRPSGIAPRESATRFTWSIGAGQDLRTQSAPTST